MRVSLCKAAFHSNQKDQSLPEPCCVGKGTLSCARLRGSYTLEAAVILPLAAGFLAFVLFFFRVLQVQTQVQEALYYAGRKSACEAGAVSSVPALLVSAEAFFQKELQQYELIDRYVAGGNWGISLLQSDLTGNYVHLQADYFIKLPINFFTIKGIFISQSSKSRKWIGDRDTDATEDYVYVTETGTVYHRKRDCSYLDLSIHTAKYADLPWLRNKDEHKYYACAECAADNLDPVIVYITDYGTCYHTNLACRGLKRSIYMIPLSEAGGRGACSKCGG